MNLASLKPHALPVKERAEQIRFTILLCFAFSLPFSIPYSSVTLTLFVVTTLLGGGFKKLKGALMPVGLFALLFLLGLVGYFYSCNKREAGLLLERQAALFIFPLLLPLAAEINKQRAELLVKSLMLASLVAVLFLFAHMFYLIIFKLRLPFFDAAFSSNFFNHQFSRPLFIHAGYLSLYVAFSIFYLVFKFQSLQTFRWRLATLAALAVLLSGLFFLASRNAAIATAVVLLFVLPLFALQNKLRYTLVFIAVAGAAFLLVKNVSYLRERFSVELISEIKPLPDGTYLNYAVDEPRVERWKGAMDLIKQSPWIGYGTGDEGLMLKTEYMKRGLFISYLEGFNAHNQYLSYLLKNGILGLLVLLFAFGYYFYLAIRTSSFIYLSFLLLIVFGFFTENILDANKGILFFSLFNTYLGYVALNELKQKTSLESKASTHT